MKFFLCVCCALIIPFLEAKVPQSSEEIDVYYESAVSEIEEKVDAARHLKKDDFEVLRAWDKVGKKYFSSLALLYSMEMLYKDPFMGECGKYACAKLMDHLVSILNQPAGMPPIYEYIEKVLKNPSSSHDSEKYYLLPFLRGKDSLFSQQLRQRIRDFKEDDLGNCLPYTYLKGKNAITSSRCLSLLNWNICFLPDSLPLIFGGVRQWEKRIDQVIEILKKEDADVICLQEVFAEDAALAFYEALKENYAHFYINIAPQNFGFEEDQIGVGSGFFVASKYAISEVHWKPFETSGSEGVGRGYFQLVVNNEGKKARIVTTHLESSLPFFPAEDYRKAQLNQIIEDISKRNESAILCGDLNIYFGSKEPAEMLLQQNFIDSYNLISQKVDFNNCTHCDLTGYYFKEYAGNENREHFVPIPFILDYALVYKNRPLEVKSSRIIPAFFVENLEAALSDHHALVTEFSW